MKIKHNKSPDKEFAKLMRTLMGNRNIRLVDISKATNNAVSTVSTWRRGRYPRSADTIRKLAEIFSVSPEYLLYGKCDGNEIIFSNETQTDFYKTSNPTEENIRRHLEAVIEDCEGDKIILTEILDRLYREFPLRKQQAAEKSLH